MSDLTRYPMSMVEAPVRSSFRNERWAGMMPRTTSYAPQDRISREEEVRLVRRAQDGDRIAAERLVAATIRLVYRVARRYRCRSYSQDDLVQEGVMGLLLAIDRFDPAQGCRLSTYAMHWIRQAIARAVGQNDAMIHVPLQVMAEARRLLKVSEETQYSLGRQANEQELAHACGLPEERVAQLTGVVREVISLEAAIGPDQDSWLLELAQDETAINPEEDALREVYRKQVRHLLARLNPRERQIVEERYGLNSGVGVTLDELSRRLSVSRERVRQIETRAIQKLRFAMREAQWD